MKIYSKPSICQAVYADGRIIPLAAFAAVAAATSIGAASAASAAVVGTAVGYGLAKYMSGNQDVGFSLTSLDPVEC